MTDLNLVSEQERAIAAVTHCSVQLRRAREDVRCAGEMLRRAIRTVEHAEGELGHATRRLGRMELAMTRSGEKVGRGPIDSPGPMAGPWTSTSVGMAGDSPPTWANTTDPSRTLTPDRLAWAS